MSFAGSSRFEILGTLGEGGMGIVYEARDRQRRMNVALKTLRKLEPTNLYRFKREFRAVSDLSHPNIVSLYELVASEEQWFFTMEVVRGGTLIDYVSAPIPGEVDVDLVTPEASARRARDAFTDLDTSVVTIPDARPASRSVGGDAAHADTMPHVSQIADLDRVSHAFGQLARALHALHQAGLVHRDLKPSNVRVTEAGRVVLMDFGIVGERSEDQRKQRATHTSGTPAYMAPEQATGEAPGAAADWYAFGVMLYVALCGTLPFTGKPRELLWAKLRKRPTPISELVTGVPEHLQRLCIRLLARKPDRRPGVVEILGTLGVDRDAVTRQTPRVFVGRSGELRMLHEVYARVERGREVGVFITGTSGMGKSTLIQRFLSQLASPVDDAAGPMILRGRCHARESLPYNAIDGVMDSLSNALQVEGEAAARLPPDIALLTRLFPVLSRVSGLGCAPPQRDVNPRELRARATFALRALLTELSATRPVIVHIDDLQWADTDSLELLVDMMGGSPKRLLVIGTLRPEAQGSRVSKAINAITVRTECIELALGPLSSPEQRELLDRLGRRGDVIGPDRGEHEMWAEAGGSPLLLIELFRFFDRAGAPGDGRALDLDGVLARRIARLPDDARRFLEAAAVAGEPTPWWMLAQTAELSPERCQRALTLLHAEQLIQIVRPGPEHWLMTYHARVRDAVIGHVEAPRLTALHARLAALFEDWPGATIDALARHFQAAGDRDKASRYLIAAAEAASDKLAFERAAGLYQAALDLARPGADVRDLLCRLGESLELAGHCYEAALTYERAALAFGEARRTDAPGDEDGARDEDGAHADDAARSDDAARAGDAARANDRAHADDAHADDAAHADDVAHAEDVADTVLELKQRAADNWLRSGHIRRGRRALAELMQELGAPYARTRAGALMSVMWQRSRLRLRGLDYQPPEPSQITRRQLNRIDTLYAAATSLGFIDFVRGAAIQNHHILAALELGEESRVCRALAIEGAYMCMAGSRGIRRGEQLGQRALDQAKQLGDPYLIGTVQLSRGIAQFYTGQIARARATLSECEGLLASARRAVEWERATARYILARAQLAIGDIAGAAAIVARYSVDAERRNDVYARTMLLALPGTWSLLCHDQPDEADRVLATVLDGWPDDAYYVAHYVEAFSRVLVSLYRRDGHEALRVMTDALPGIRKLMLIRVPWIKSEVYTLIASAALHIGDTRQADQACTMVAQLGVPYTDAHAALIQAAIAHQSAQPDSAACALTRAIEQFDAASAPLMKASCEIRLGQLLGGDDGRALQSRGETTLIESGVIAPDRLLELLAPGFTTPD